MGKTIVDSPAGGVWVGLGDFVVRLGCERRFEKISKIILFWLLLLIPTQLGKHFWFDWSLVWGMRVDYFSPTVM